MKQSKFAQAAVIVLLLSIFGLVACGGGQPNVDVQVFTKTNQIFNVNYDDIVITAKGDNVVVKHVTANHGNCQVRQNDILTGQPIFPATLAFGQKLEVDVPTGCDVIEVDVTTNAGSWAMSFNDQDDQS